MKMKTWVSGLWVLGMGVGLAGLAPAQMVGLPLMDTATSRDAGSLEITPGVVCGNDMDFYGARATVTVVDDLRVFFDLGRVDINNGDANFGLQGGALYSLPQNDVVDLGVRGALYYVNTDFLALTGLNTMLVFSDELLLDNLYLYGGAGFDLGYKSVDTSWGASSSKTELNPALSLGLSYQFNESFALFTEADYVDGYYVGIGLSIR